MSDNKESGEKPVGTSRHIVNAQPLSEVKPSIGPNEDHKYSQPVSEIIVTETMPISEKRPTPPPDASKRPPSGKK